MNDLYKAYYNGYEFKLGSYLSKSWKRFGEEVGPFIGMGLLFLIVNISLSFVPILGAANGFITTILFAGFYVFCRNMDNQTNTGADFLKGFNFIGNIFIYQLIILLILVPLFMLVFSSIIPFSLVMDMINGNIAPEDFGDYIEADLIENVPFFLLQASLFFAVAIYLSISYSLTIPLIVDTKLGFWEAMELSRRTIGKNFISFLFFWIIYGIAVAIGIILTCGVGLLLIIPFSYVLIFEMYDQIFEPFSAQEQESLNSN